MIGCMSSRTRQIAERLLGFWCLLLMAASVSAQDIEMYPGEVDTVNVGTVDRVAVGDEEVAKVSVMDDGKLLIVANAPGETDLVIWQEGQRESRYGITVTTDNVSRRHRMVRSALSEFPGLTTREVNGLIIISGELDPEDMKRYETLVGELTGVVSQVKPKEVPMRDMIKLKAQILEVDQDYRRNLGVDWDDTLNGPTVAAVGTGVSNDEFQVLPEEGNVNFENLSSSTALSERSFYPFVGIATGLTSSINLMKHQGAARTLAEPVLITRSGETAEFLSGGEIPFETQDEVGNSIVQFREFGIQLEIEPRSDGDGNILAMIDAEVSSADFATGVEGVPGLDTRRANSVVNVQSGETILISGLVSTEDNVSHEGIPYLSEIPYLGSLFSFTDRSESRKELIILVTPEITNRGEDVGVWNRLKPHMKELQEIQKNDDIDNHLQD